MKKFQLCLALSFLIISCSTESEFSPSENVNSSEIVVKTNSKMPENKKNPFDAKGKEYYDLIAVYLQNNSVPNSILDTANQLQFLLKNYSGSSLTGRSIVSITPEQVALIMNDPEIQLTTIVESCDLSTATKQDLISFLRILIAQQGLDYKEVYDSIVSYETSISESTTLYQYEKETILTVSSVTRYALYADSTQRDRDWEISVANRKSQKAYNSYKASIVSVMLLFRKLD